jgi:LysM domain-containing protein/lysozyme-like protein
MTTKYRTQDQIIRMLRRAGFGPRPARVGAAIALCEAPVFGAPEPTADFGLVGDLDLVNDTWGPSFGGFQIRSLKSQKGTGQYRDGDELLKVAFNCESARTIYLNSGWGAWSTYSSGMYKAYLQDWFPPPPHTHIVLAGETVSTIAALYDMKWQELARLNNLHAPYTIYIGQALLYEDAT